MSADPLVLAYLAGVIDSDGFISITHSTRTGAHYFGPHAELAAKVRDMVRGRVRPDDAPPHGYPRPVGAS